MELFVRCLLIIAAALSPSELPGYNRAMKSHGIPPITEFEIFDSVTVLGKFIHPECPMTFENTDDLISMMDTYGISEALTVSAKARTMQPRNIGNEELLSMTKNRQQLHPVFLVNPEYPDASDGTAAEAVAAGVKAVQLPFGFVKPVPEIWESSLKLLESRRIPAFCCFGTNSIFGAPDYQDIQWLYELTRRFPDLPFIMTAVMGGLGIPPELFHLVLKRENVFIDILGILTFWREAVKQSGAEKVVFASGAPFVEPGILLYNVQYEPFLSVPEKRKIYSENIMDLIRRTA